MLNPTLDPSLFPAVVAHRGASSDHPENTLPSFQAAIEAGAQFVEADVRLTADGVPVILHDAEVSRTTDGTGFVHEMTYEEVRRLDASMGRGPRTEIPSLSDLLELAHGRAGVNLEIKNLPGYPGFDPADGVVDATLRDLERTGFEGPVLICSFNPGSVARSRISAPGTPTGLLAVEEVDPRDALGLARDGGHAFVGPAVGAVLRVGEAFVGEAHAAGVRVATWTVDDEETLRTLFRWGVDAVASNDPVLALRIRAEHLAC